MDPNEPEIIKYEEILLPEEEDEPGTSKEDSSESSSEDESSDIEAKPFSPSEYTDRTNRIKAEMIDRILDCIVAPRKIERGKKTYLLKLSKEPSNRNEVAKLSKRFEQYIRERQVRMRGFCPVRRELYDYLFDELIRQATIFCPERGSLLLRVRDEFKMTLAAYEKLFENGVEYGTRKAHEAEIQTESLRLQRNQLKAELDEAEKRITEYKEEMTSEDKLSQQRIEVKQLQHEKNMEYFKKANEQLKEQLSYVS